AFRRPDLLVQPHAAARPEFWNEPCLLARHQEIDRRPEEHLEDQIEIEKGIERERTDKKHDQAEYDAWVRYTRRSKKENDAGYCLRKEVLIAANELSATRWGRRLRTSARRYLLYSVKSTRRASGWAIQPPLSRLRFTTG